MDASGVVIQPENDGLTPQQRYRKSEKCKIARKAYYERKGKEQARNYYVQNREKIIQRSKERYAKLIEAANK